MRRKLKITHRIFKRPEDVFSELVHLNYTGLEDNVDKLTIHNVNGQLHKAFTFNKKGEMIHFYEYGVWQPILKATSKKRLYR